RPISRHGNNGLDFTVEAEDRESQLYDDFEHFRRCSDYADIFQSSDVSMGRSCGYCVVFGALCYPTNNSEDLGKLQPTADTGIFVGYAPSKKGYRIYNKRTRHKLRSCTKSSSCNSLCTPTNKELEILFQPMFDEYLEPPRAEKPSSPAQAVQAPVTSAGTPFFYHH
nr:retrovirus-related Pol polyprotein from transposon TNT 1-94 [Tanacetum cinerariifolium]